MTKLLLVQRMLIRALILCFFAFAIIPTERAYATHAMGADFTYTCLGGNNYEFTVAFYRDCAGIDAPSSVSISISSASCSVNTNITLSQQGPPIELTNLCIGNPNSTCNGGTDPGAEQYIYSGTYTLPAQCNDWVFSWTHCCRNGLITNLQNPEDENIYIETTLNNTGGICNSSPVFSTLPVPFICEGDTFCYNHGASDTDGDSLVYSLINPRTSSGSPISYTAGYSPTYPIFTNSGSVGFNSTNGQMCFIPNGLQVSVVTILIEEYRSGVLVGSTMRDIQIIVLDCSNKPPPLYFTAPCGGDFITLIIEDPVLCSSIASDGSDFTLTGPGGPFTITGASGVNCGTLASQITIYITPGIVLDSTYTLFISAGTDGNTLINDCGVEMPDTSITFIAEPAPASISGNNTICRGKSTNLTASPGTGYLWSPGGETTQTITVSPTNTTTYNVIIYNDTCSQNASITVTVNDAPVAGFTFSPDPVCVGQPVNFTNSSSTNCFIPVLFYFWDFGDGGVDLLNENPSHTYSDTGTYTVSLNVIDGFCGCDNIFTQTVTVISCSCAMTVSVTPTAASCNGVCDGTATANPSGGTTPYTYQWDANAGNQTTQTATGLCAGSYSVAITDANSCTGSDSVTVNQPALLSVTVSYVDVSCNGDSNGTATATPNGGASPYSYSWSDGQATAIAIGLTAGIYIITITDNNNCSADTSVTINEPAAINLTTGSTPENCGLSDGTATISAAGGTLPYTYLWNDSLGQTTTIATGLPAGSYVVIVTDSNNCSEVAPVIVNGTGGPALTTAAIDVTCNGGNDGQATVVPSGGILPYTYLWNDSLGQDTAIATGLPAGNYDIMVTDSGNCTTIASVTVNEPLIIDLSLSSTPAACGISDGTATVNASGGTGSFTYSWSPTGGTSASATGLAAGSYAVAVTDSNGCTETDSIVVANTGGPTASITSSINITCFAGSDGQAAVSVSGGATPYSYSWSPAGGNSTIATGLTAGTYTVTVTDSGGCISTDAVTITQPDELILTTSGSDISCFNGNDGTANVSTVGGTAPYTFSWTPTGGNDSITSGLNAGTYTVSVTDNNGCTVLGAITITEPSAIVLSLTVTQAACASSDGSADVVASGGTGFYTYSWSPSGGTTPSATGLAAGIYTVIVTDANGCSQADSIAVTNIGGAALSITDLSMVSCKGGNDGSATVAPSGGTPAYTYSWNTSPVQTDSMATGLTAGFYNVTVTDAAGCISIIAATISEPDSIIITLTADTIICIGDSVAISVSATGGTAPYTYTWDNGLNTDSAHTVSPDSATTYTVIVFDANLCPVVAQSVTVATNTPLSVTAFGTATICASTGDSTLITANASGGDGGPYTYSWSNGAGTGNPVFVSPANTTTYIVTVSDACGSPVAIDSVTITVNPELVLIPTSANICPGESVVLNVSGALSYWWVDETTMDTVGTGPTITVNPSVTTNYLITGYDGVCYKTDTVSVTVNPPPVADFGFNPPETIITNPTFYFEDLSSPGVISWFWDFGDGDTSTVEDPTHTYADTGTYPVMLIVFDSAGCPDTVIKDVFIKGEYILFAPSAFTPNEDLYNDYFMPKGMGIDGDNFEMYIYDRWGDLIATVEGVFDNENTTLGWDGRANNGRKIAQQDVYIWLILTRDIYGKRHRYIGHVTLIR